MSHQQNRIDWIEPLIFAEKIAENEAEFVFLYSGEKNSNSENFSYLALFPQEKISSDKFSSLSSKLSNNRSKLENAWFGYFGYELLHDVENIEKEQNSYIILPDLYFVRFGLIIEFDHKKKIINYYAEPNIKLPDYIFDKNNFKKSDKKYITHDINYSMSREEYFRIIEETKEEIRKGSFYQANITRKIMGKFIDKPNGFSIFMSLCKESPASYSAFFKTKDFSIISSSPENFLNINKDGVIKSSPIKGTVLRYRNKKLDKESLDYLSNSEKEKAENLMIVDLMRNDLAINSVAGSVKVENLFKISSYKTLHHLSSTIIAQKSDNASTLNVVKSAFPAGSMTGAPKISAIKWCMKKEKIRRGVYSGALGWFGGDGSCDLSVVIRTLIISGNRFEFQVGGGITIDSDAESEWQETITKAKGIMKALERCA
ncbi:MAG: chorismate-binding protein [Pseudomonadota bacterium]